MENKRIVCLKSSPVRQKARYVMYWMQMFKRVENNHALNFAIAQANELKLPLLVYEGLKYYYPYACDRIHQFILENSIELKKGFQARGIRYLFHLERQSKERYPTVLHLAKAAAMLVTDDFPAFIIPRHNDRVARTIDIPFFAVDSNGIVPLREFTKQEYAARTIRPKIRRLLPDHLKPMEKLSIDKDSSKLRVDWQDTPLLRQTIEKWVAECAINHAIKPSIFFKGGGSEAHRHLKEFLDHKLENYAQTRNDPSVRGTSNLSPYLHFGMISPLEVALKAKKAGRNELSTEAFLEELIVRRELSYNFTRFSGDYETLMALPRWVQENLSRHACDRRPNTYSLKEFEEARTHDPIWNACQQELLTEGKIHGYMRMYWGKKILEWSRTYAEALKTMIFLNNQYGLDGRNPNSWTGILWCFGLHDRPWGSRPVYGTIRSMSGENLKRKVDVEGYIARVKVKPE